MTDERLAGGVVLRDVSDLLPVHAKKRFNYRKKPPAWLCIHHAGVDNQRVGFHGARATARYHVDHKNWAGIGYHYYVPRKPSNTGVAMVYRVGADYTVRAHTRGLNTRADGLMLQGHLGHQQLTEYQEECLEAFVPWWMEQDPDHRKGITWHSNAWKQGAIPKFACPGKHAVRWLERWEIDTFRT